MVDHGEVVIGIFRELAKGLFFLRTGWKTLGDRRLQLPAALTAIVVLNYITVASAIDVFLSVSGHATRFDPISTPILIVLMIGVWLFMRFAVVTYEFFDKIVEEEKKGLSARRAKKKFVGYFALSAGSYIALLIWIGFVGPL